MCRPPLADFERVLPQLNERDFPKPDPTTGNFCIEAIDKWRLRRHPSLFPMLTTTPTAIHAEAVRPAKRQGVTPSERSHLHHLGATAHP